MEDIFGIYINVLCPKLTVILSQFFFVIVVVVVVVFLVRSSKPPHLKDLRPAS